MDRLEATSGRQAGNDVGAQVRRFAVIVGKPARDGSACRVEDPGRLLRVWSLLQATSEQLDRAALPPEGTPGLQRQLRAIRHELEDAVSPPLAAELRRMRHRARARCGSNAVLLSWAGSLVIQMLSALVVARERLPVPSAAASSQRPRANRGTWQPGSPSLPGALPDQEVSAGVCVCRPDGHDRSSWLGEQAPI